MITVSDEIRSMLEAPARKIDARVELFEGFTSSTTYNETLIAKYTCHDCVKTITIDRIGEESKLFGFGICQKATIVLRDKDREITDVVKGYGLEVSYGINNNFTYPYPIFFVQEVTRNENNNDLTIVAYDLLFNASRYKVKDLNVNSYTIKTFAELCANILQVPLIWDFDIVENPFIYEHFFANGGNFDGSETIREALNAIAEFTGSIYYVNREWQLVFKQLGKSNPVEITKARYFTLTNDKVMALSKVAHVTELGDNFERLTYTQKEGFPQYVRENPFFEMLPNAIGGLPLAFNTATNNAIALSITPFDCSWRGDFTYEIGEKLSIESKTGEFITTYLLNDTIIYDGGLRERTSWAYQENSAEADDRPATLGDKMNQTFAKVDKVNRTITLMSNTMDEKIAQLVLTDENIQASVKNNKAELESSLNITADTIRSEIKEQGKVITSIQQDLDGITMEYNSSTGKASITIGNITVDDLTTEAGVKQVLGIELLGYVKFSSLSTSGATVINGDNITTGKISANRINMTGAISWGDLSDSCQDTIISYAGQDGEDADLPSYIHSTYIDETKIYSPKIYGAQLTAGTSSDGYIQMAHTGLDFISNEGGHLMGIGYHEGNYNLPYIVFGDGVDSVGTDRGLIKKYTTGIWIGDSDNISSSSPNGTGLFIDFTTNSLYFYDGSGSRKALASPS